MSDHIHTTQWRRLGELFEQAIDLDAAGRAELLLSVEREDAELGQVLASLLDADARHHGQTAAHRERVLQDSFHAIYGEDLTVGDRVGQYVLRESLGHGGMGVVFRAERADGQVRQDVALKVVKLGMDTREVIARFEVERQALALMEHPHIARMLDAGTTDSGRPYFVMELVKGEPIWRYCIVNGLTIDQRLRLFEQVCAAVQHAHTKGIIHRDLKPTNVLVSTQEGQPFAKVIDFGIAKATSGRLTEKTLMTQQFLMMGTPLYMSPEQAAGSADIDTRSDIYALGAILYELLTNTTPIDSDSLQDAAHEEVQRIIREVDPPRPSARLSQSTTTRPGTVTEQGVDVRALAKAVRGELDWIVMKALEKDRSRRYETASALAMDVRRYLEGEAVQAAPPGAAYRLRKWIRRNRATFAAGSMVAVALLVGIVAFAWQARIAQQQARLARQRAHEVEQVATFEGDMLRQVDPNKAGRDLVDDLKSKLAAALVKAGVPEKERSAQAAAFAGLLRWVNATDTAVGVIDRTTMKPAIAAIDQRFKDQPVVAARLRQVLADRYVQMGLYDAAMPLMKSALATRRRVLGEEDRETLQSLGNIGALAESMENQKEAEPYLREALAKRRRILGEDDPDTVESMGDLGQHLTTEGQLKEAEPLLRQALATSRRVNGQGSAETVELIASMGYVLNEEGRMAEAERYLREAIAKNDRAVGGDPAKRLDLIDNMGWTLWQQGKIAEAEAFQRGSLERSRRSVGEDHPLTVDKVYSLAGILMAEGKLGEAEGYMRESLEKRRRIFGEGHPFALMTRVRLGTLLDEEGKPGEAEASLRMALDGCRRAFGDHAGPTVYTIAVLGGFLRDNGRMVEAESYLRKALDDSRRAFGSDSEVTLYAMAQMGQMLVAQGKFAEAEKLLAPLEARARGAVFNGDMESMTPAMTSLGMARTGLGEFAAAETDLLEAQPRLTVDLGPKARVTRRCTQALGDLYAAWNAAHPGEGHDTQSAAWKRKLDALGAPVSVVKH
jgi:serine/threonine protein kinase/tetratricopeptide (TPR) repeat protein